MSLNMIPGKPHRDLDDVISVPVELRYEDIRFTVFVRLDETGKGRSYVEAPSGVTLGAKLTDTLIEDAAHWSAKEEIEDRRELPLEKLVVGEAKFNPEPWYNTLGDSIELLLADEAEVAHHVDGVLTILNSAIDERPIGFQVRGVAGILRKFGRDTLSVKEGSISLGALLIAAYEDGPNSIERRKRYGLAASLLTSDEGILASEIPL